MVGKALSIVALIIVLYVVGYYTLVHYHFFGPPSQTAMISLDMLLLQKIRLECQTTFSDFNGVHSGTVLIADGKAYFEAKEQAGANTAYIDYLVDDEFTYKWVQGAHSGLAFPRLGNTPSPQDPVPVWSVPHTFTCVEDTANRQLDIPRDVRFAQYHIE